MYDLITGARGNTLRGKEQIKELFNKQRTNAMKLSSQAAIFGTWKVFRIRLAHAQY